MIKLFDSALDADMGQVQNVTIDVAVAVQKRGRRSVGRVKKYASAAERVAACRARKNKKAATFDLSPDVLERLDEFMRLRVDSKNPDETKSQVVERALKYFFRKR